MADDFQIQGGSGPFVATNDISGKHYQKIKLHSGEAGATAPVHTGNGTHVNALRATLANDSDGQVGLFPKVSGGLLEFHLVSANSTNATVIKALQGQVYGWSIFNNNANPRKVAFHNSASTPTAGSGVFITVVIPGGENESVFLPYGIEFDTGIGITTVTGLGDSNSTSVAADDLVINIFYK